MAELKDWNTSAASNNDTPPDGAPEGMAPSAVNDVMRENMAVLARWKADNDGSLTSGGTANAQTLTANGTYSALARGDTFAFVPGAANTGACTLNVDSLGAEDIKMPDGSDPPAGALDTDSIVYVVFDGTHFILTAGDAANSLSSLSVTGDVDFSGATVSDLGTVTTADINGGTVDGTVLGGASAAAATVTDLTATGTVDLSAATVSDLGSVTTADINGGTVDGAIVGGSTPAAGSFTTLTASGNAQVSGETFSVSGSTSVPSATWTTIRSFSATDIEQGMVTVFFLGTTSGLVGAYNKLYDGGASDGGASFINRVDAADVRISGDNLQVYHNTGATVTASWYCLITRIT